MWILGKDFMFLPQVYAQRSYFREQQAVMIAELIK